MIEQLIEEFDFKRVEEVMQATNWKWTGLHDDNCGCKTKIPDIETMKKTVRHLYNLALKSNKFPSTASTGGFAVEIDGDLKENWKHKITISFIVTKKTIETKMYL